MRPFARFSVVAFFALALPATSAAFGCKGGSGGRDPMTVTASQVKVVTEVKNDCKKIGSVDGRGRDSNPDLADQQGIDAAREQAARLGGEFLVITDTKAEPEAGSGGTVTKVTKSADVYTCPKEEAPKTESSGAPTSESTAAPAST